MSRKVLVPCILSLLLLVSSIVVSDVAAAWLPPANTDVCWGASGHIIRLRFINVGGGYYQVAGKMTEPGGIIGALFGSAVTTSSLIHVTATWSGSDSSNIWMETGRIKINRTTLALSGYGAGIDKESGPYDGSFTAPKINCP